MENNEDIQPVILAGGKGSRLWPLSTDKHPKQLLALTDNFTLLQQTVLRVHNTIGYRTPWIVTQSYNFIEVSTQLARIGVTEYKLIQAPLDHSTALVYSMIAKFAIDEFGHNVRLLFLPSDHFILGNFRENVYYKPKTNRPIKLFGVTPTQPNTQYGYMQIDKTSNELSSFIEKPETPEDAQELINSGYLWNTGIIQINANTVLELIPADMMAYVSEIKFETDSQWIRYTSPITSCSPLSFDKLVLSQHKYNTFDTEVVTVDFKWTDIGSWDSLHSLLVKDESGNVLSGSARQVNSTNNLVLSVAQPILTENVENLTVVATAEQIYVRGKKKDTVKTIHRLWGYYEILYEKSGYKIKKLVVLPGKSLSMQRHVHRNEHWVVVSGVGKVFIDGEEGFFTTITIPKNTWHQLINVGKIPLVVIETQIGDYLEEDDIERK